MTAEADIIDEGRLARARQAAGACGVSRLADITGLDRLGVPVFQAIRPASRALAVHQGKAFTPQGAQLGALMEAVESDHAERFEPRGPTCAWEDLPGDLRPADLADFARERQAPPAAGEGRAWTEAERLTGGKILVPFESVSLDFERPWDRRIDHTSNGLGARFDRKGAILKGLLEVLERDAAATWVRRPLAFRAVTRVRRESIRLAWFGELGERLAAAGVSASVFSLPTLAGLSTFRVELKEIGAKARASALAGGVACDAEPEAALEGAMLEALQSRLAAISGARDDILYRGPHDVRAGAACPLPPGEAPLDWAVFAERRGEPTLDGIVERLAAIGYPDTCAVQLSAADAPVCVAKVFVPGSAAFGRSRRAPE